MTSFVKREKLFALNTMKNQMLKISDYILLNAYSVESSGLYNGKAGISLALFEVSRLLKDEYLEEHAFELLQEALLYKGDDISFANGFLGIGFVLHYLVENDFVEADIDDLLGEQEQKIQLASREVIPISQLAVSTLSTCIDRLYLLRCASERNREEIEQLEAYLFSSDITDSYTGTYDGSSGCLNNSGNSYYYPDNGNSNPNLPNNGSSYNNGVFDSGSTYTSDNPCSYDDYCIQMSSGTWGGGFVQGVGYVGSSKTGNATDDVAIDGSSRFTSTFDFESRGWKLVENVGITMQFNIKGGVVIENGIIMVSAAGICQVNGAVFSGQIDLLVNGSVVESQLLQSSSGGSFIQGGYQEIGSASFNKAKYGYANVQVRLIASYNNGNYDGTGFWAPKQINEIVYSSNK